MPTHRLLRSRIESRDNATTSAPLRVMGANPEIERAVAESSPDKHQILLGCVNDDISGLVREKTSIEFSLLYHSRVGVHHRFRFFTRAGSFFPFGVCAAHRFAIFGCFANMNRRCAFDLNGIGHHRGFRSKHCTDSGCETHTTLSASYSFESCLDNTSQSTRTAKKTTKIIAEATSNASATRV